MGYTSSFLMGDSRKMRIPSATPPPLPLKVEARSPPAPSVVLFARDAKAFAVLSVRAFASSDGTAFPA